MEESCDLLLCRWHEKACFSKVHRSPPLHTVPPRQRLPSLLSKSWNLNSSTEWQSTTLQVPGSLLPKVHKGPVLPTEPDSRKAWQWECHISHWEEESYKLLHHGEHQKACFHKVPRSLALPTVPTCRRVPSLLFKSWNPSYLHWMAIHHSAGARRPASRSAQRHSAPHCDWRRVPTSSSKSGNPSSFPEGRKEVICTTTRTLQGVTFPA
jgi:hypothetical protein